ncbi:hypothetical protein [Bacillus dakarensis]|uniref:hypothetical protein n=1 Tax=Robertmurraya dakarensis TaxID=1926278 RepID=UPI0009817A7C|nr:hypothetical protein [Bacillus dakarensis]
MTVFFGSVEFFEREIINFLQENQTSVNEIPVSMITTRIESEVLDDFVCDERIRVECLKNLRCAIDLMMKNN